MTAEGVGDAAKAIGWHINRIRVDRSTIRFTDVEAWKRYIFFTPAHVSAAILLFEQGIKPAPFGFVLRRNNAAQVIDTMRISSFPSRVARRQVKVTTRRDNRKRKSMQSVTVMGGKPLPLMPRQTTRMFGQCGMSPNLFKIAAGMK